MIRASAVLALAALALAILGVPEADGPFILRLTREYFGNADAELNRGRTPRSGVDAIASTRARARCTCAACWCDSLAGRSATADL